MHPTELSDQEMAAYVADGHWTRETIVDQYRAHAQSHPDKIACHDIEISYTWRELEEVTDRVAAHLMGLNITRDARAMVQIPTSTKEIVLRIAFKKAGIIAAFVPMQWRRLELTDVLNRLEPNLVVMALEHQDSAQCEWITNTVSHSYGDLAFAVDVSASAAAQWLSWDELTKNSVTQIDRHQLLQRAFRYDEISLITASSGTSGLSKLCEWPEAAQLCVGRAIAERLRLSADDHIGIFSPMSGAAGLLVWLVSASVACQFRFPKNYHASDLLAEIAQHKITVVTTVPVILTRLSRESLAQYDLSSLRCVRVGTAAANTQSAYHLESQTNCRVVVASGSMECPGFGHADFDEPQSKRLNGSVGFPLPGGQLRVCDEHGNDMVTGETGELLVRAPFASSGYWQDSVATQAAWSQGWYKTGDVACYDEDGRLRLLGRVKELINRSGHKILPAEVEQILLQHPNVVDCAVVGAPDDAYGWVPWAFVQLLDPKVSDSASFSDHLQRSGLAIYKIPTRFIPSADLLRINGNKVDKKGLLQRELGKESG